jgi:tRNA pseudouridine38-40 synthase
MTIIYDGSDYYGFAPQPNKKTVIGTIEETFKKSVNLDIKVLGSGRTDKGVHATGQVIHTDIPAFWDSDLNKLKLIINKNLPQSSYIKSIQKTDDNFHSRFSAKRRVYRYIISTKPTTVFNNKYCTYIKGIDEVLIKKAIKVFEGVHDFNLFRKVDKSVDNSIREVFKTRFYKYNDFYIFYFEANAYLRSQIRIMVDFLLKISNQELTIENLQEQLDNKKSYSNTLASASGLYLAKIKY